MNILNRMMAHIPVYYRRIIAVSGCFSLLYIVILVANSRTSHLYTSESNSGYRLSGETLGLSPSASSFVSSSSQKGFFLIDPHLLQRLDPNSKFRFGRSLNFTQSPDVLTLGTFNPQLNTAGIENVTEIESVYGRSPFLDANFALHHFVWTSTSQIVHIVVFHKIENFFWVGALPEHLITKLNTDRNMTFSPTFGVYEQIFDPFILVSGVSGTRFHAPSEIGHFLGQIATSRYLHCPEIRKQWIVKYGIPYNANTVRLTHGSIVSMKSFMKELQFEFWIMCGTLLGWYRQCSAIPYTTDADFGTWASSLDGRDLSSLLHDKAPDHGLRLFYRFGEPTKTQEFSFKNVDKSIKNDLFFIYPNETHFLLPWHIASKKQWAYSIYPKFELCSGVLLGEKVLVPCEPPALLSAEYGPTWMKPVVEEEYDWIKSPRNVSPFYPFNFSISQYTQYD